MKDILFYNLGGSSVSRSEPYEKTVTEIKAPTDDSIRLYKEMVEKAEKSVMDAFHIKNNIMEGSVAINRTMSRGMDSYDVHYKFILNGQSHAGGFPYEGEYSRDAMQYEVLQRMAQTISKNLTQNIMENFMKHSKTHGGMK